MKRFTRTTQPFILGLCSGAVILLAGCATKEASVKESQVPPAVLQAFRQQYPAATFKGCAKEGQGSNVVYEVFTDGKTAPHTVIYTPDGKVAETEVQIPAAQLPSPVQAALKQASPTGAVKLVEISQEGGKTLYEVEITEGSKVFQYVFDPAGKLLAKEAQ